MKNKLAKAGDTVNFKMLDGSHINGEILYMPCQGHDNWVIQSYYEGRKDLVMYISQFQFMTVYPDNEESK